MEEQFIGCGETQPRGDRPGIYNTGSLRHLLCRMWLLEQLLRYLTKVVDETNGRVLFQWIINAIISKCNYKRSF